VITVVNVKKFKGQYVYCGRASASRRFGASPLANPFPLRDEADRALILAKYKRWFDSRVQDGDGAVADALAQLLSMASRGDLNLGCYCAPKACHCDVIKEFLEGVLNATI
jgi:hypothetical protein